VRRSRCHPRLVAESRIPATARRRSKFSSSLTIGFCQLDTAVRPASPRCTLPRDHLVGQPGAQPTRSWLGEACNMKCRHVSPGSLPRGKIRCAWTSSIASSRSGRGIGRSHASTAASRCCARTHVEIIDPRARPWPRPCLTTNRMTNHEEIRHDVGKRSWLAESVWKGGTRRGEESVRGPGDLRPRS